MFLDNGGQQNSSQENSDCNASVITTTTYTNHTGTDPINIVFTDHKSAAALPTQIHHSPDMFDGVNENICDMEMRRHLTLQKEVNDEAMEYVPVVQCSLSERKHYQQKIQDI